MAGCELPFPLKFKLSILGDDGDLDLVLGDQEKAAVRLAVASATTKMDFWTYTPLRDAMKQLGVQEDAESFFRSAFARAVKMASGEFYGQVEPEALWEQGHRPCCNVGARRMALG